MFIMDIIGIYTIGYYLAWGIEGSILHTLFNMIFYFEVFVFVIGTIMWLNNYKYLTNIKISKSLIAAATESESGYIIRMLWIFISGWCLYSNYMVFGLLIFWRELRAYVFSKRVLELTKGKDK